MSSRYWPQHGFTLVELAITVVVLGILTAIGLPSFTTFLRNTEQRSASESVLHGIQLARAEAVRRNERVRFVIDPNTAWAVYADGAGTTLQSKPTREGGPHVTLAFTPTVGRRVTFNSFGRVTANADATAALTQIDFSATGASMSRRITIAAGGQIALCDPSIQTSGDPRKC